MVWTSPVVQGDKNLLTNSGGHKFDLAQEKILHAAESNQAVCATASGVQALESMLCYKRRHSSEKLMIFCNQA